MSQPDESPDAPRSPDLVTDLTGEPIPEPASLATVTVAPGARRIVLTGEIDLAVSADLDLAARQAAESPEQVEVELGEVSFMDSIGVGFVAKLIMAGRTHGWRPRLVGAQPQVVETLTISGVIDAVDLVDPAS
jgi:anti-anti-sigma factor